MGLGTYDDIIIQTRLPEQIIRDIEKLYSNIKQVEDLNFEDLMKIATKNVQFRVTVMKNPQLARQNQDSVIQTFKKAR